MFDVITVGSAVEDVFLSGSAFKPHTEPGGERVAEFPLGAKIEVENVVNSTGGGATNAAVTFARQGLKPAFLGSIGQDPAGEAIEKMFDDEGVDYQNVAYDEEYATDYSTLLLSPDGERTILIYRGASHNLNWADYDTSSLNAKWAYMTSCAGNFEFINAFVDWANQKNIKVSMDPGKLELEDKVAMHALLPRLTMIKANREELGSLVDEDEPEKIIKALADQVDYAIVTDGSAGSWASDGKTMVKAGLYEDVYIKDRTGAGDAFGSGFVASIIKGGGLVEAMTLGSANSTSVVQFVGAKEGILRGDTSVHAMPLEISAL